MASMSAAPIDPGRSRRLCWALTLSFLVTAVLAYAGFIIGSLMPGNAKVSVADLLGMVAVFGFVFLLFYFTTVRKTPRMLEIERVARLGEELSRRQKS